jgi:carbon-monoxide dehydrogenase large subunit
VSPSRAVAGSAPNVGRPLPRREDRPLLTGRGTYIDDVSCAEVLAVHFLRSPMAHARVTAIDTAAAKALAGVTTVVTASDLDLGPLLPPLEIPGVTLTPRPLLADGAVRFVGEPIAAVVASSTYVAEDAAELIGLELDPLPPISCVDDALADGAPPVSGYPSSVLYEATVHSGDVEAAMASAAVTVERTFVNPRCSAMPIEPRGALAIPDGDGVRVWSSTQAPHKLAQLLAELLHLERSQVTVLVPDVGGGFGQKAHVYPEEIVATWLALRCGRPIRWTEDRAENLMASSHAREQVVRVRAAAAADGVLLAMDADVVCDTGAYGVYPHGHVLEALGTPAMIPGPYRLGAYRARSRSVATNKCPEGAYRGVGLPVSTFVHERLMDIIASELGLDRAEIRQRNLLRAADLPYTTVTGQPYDSGDYGRALTTALEAVGYETFEAERKQARAQGRLIGLGLCCYVEYTGINSRVFTGRGMVGIAGYDGAHLSIDDSGRVTVWMTLPSIGQGVETTFAQLAADGLGVAYEDVTIARADTSVGEMHGTGAFASRSAISGGGAIGEACDVLRTRLREDAAGLMEADPADLEIVNGRVYVVGSPTSSVSVGELVQGAEDAERYRTSATFDPPSVAFPYATHACRVEVDPETGGVQIDRYVVVEDCGRMVNPVIVEGQVHGAVAQGIGGALFESLIYDAQGQLLTASLLDYVVPTAAEIASLEVHHLEIPAPGTPHGVKGVGEGGTLGPPAALANAVSDALGVECNELPLTPERVQSGGYRRAA